MGQIIMWVLLLGLGLLMILFKDFIKKHQKVFGLVIGVLLVIARIWRGSGYLIDGEPYRAVPLQLCSISTYLALFYFLFDWKGLEKYLFFFGFLGLTSFIDPDVAWGEVRTGYIFGFVYDHLIITLAPLYLVVIKDFKFTLKDVLLPYIVMVVLLFISWPITYAWEGSNFFYIIKKPVFADIFPEESFHPRLYDFLWIFAFQFAFVVLNSLSLLIIKLVQRNPKFLTNKRDE